MYFCCGFHVSCIRYLCTGRSRNYINLFPVHSWLQYTVQYCTADLQPYYISVLELRHILEQVMQSVYSLGTSRHSSLGMLQHYCLVLSQHFSFGTSLHNMIGMFSHIWRGSSQHVFGNLITCLSWFVPALLSRFIPTLFLRHLHSFALLYRLLVALLFLNCSELFTWYMVNLGVAYSVLHTLPYCVEHFCSGTGLV